MEQNVVTILKSNGIAVVATDTLYGILGAAYNEAVVRRIYELKGRDENKPFIILIPTIETLTQFGIVLSDSEKEKMSQWWPAPLTVILPIPEDRQEQFSYLHRGTNEIAFRMPDKGSLRALLQETGPLVAPSANPQGQAPAQTIEMAKEYFGDNVDYYADEGEVQGQPSTIIRLHNGAITLIRQGVYSIDLFIIMLL